MFAVPLLDGLFHPDDETLPGDWDVTNRAVVNSNQDSGTNSMIANLDNVVTAILGPHGLAGHVDGKSGHGRPPLAKGIVSTVDPTPSGVVTCPRGEAMTPLLKLLIKMRLHSLLLSFI